MSVGNSVLCVEDEPNDAFLMRIAFDEAGHGADLHFVCDGAEAIEYLSGLGEFADRERYPLPTLLLLDLNMPRVSGQEFLRWLRVHPEHRRRMAVVFSSSGHELDVNEALEAGANAYVVKPLTMQGRLAFVRALYGFWFEWHQCGDQPWRTESAEADEGVGSPK